MKEFTYTGTFDVDKLHGEIWAAYPNWRIVDGVRIFEQIAITYDGTILVLSLPDEADDATIARIIQLHDPASYTPIGYEVLQEQRRAFMALPSWSTWTPQEGADYITANILNGYDKTQAGAYIDSTIGTVTGTSLATALTSINAQLSNVRTVLKLIAGAIIDLRGIAANMAKTILFLRDIVVKYRV